MITEETIRQFIADNRVLLFMKGTPDAPQCGFSLRACTALRGVEVSFAYVNVLQSPRIREGLPRISGFPTFPQLFIRGELIGGSDIVEQLAESGELLDLIRSSVPAGAEGVPE